MVSFQEFLNNLGQFKQMDIPFYYRNQFKIKENFINPNSKHFDQIAQKLLSEDNEGIKKKWDKQCKMLFIWIIVKYFQTKNKKTINPNIEEWQELQQIFNIDENILKQRWITLINPMAKSINWEVEEDNIIKSLMKEQEEKHIWTQIALELYNHNNGQYVRTPKQVRERWMNYLNPNLKKSNWSEEEDLQLLKMVLTHGKRWSLISTLLQGRTENQVKNRFKSLIHKIYKEEDDDDVEELTAIKIYLSKQPDALAEKLDLSENSILKNRKSQKNLTPSEQIKQQQQKQDPLPIQSFPEQILKPKRKKVKVIENIMVKQEIHSEVQHSLNQQFCLSTNGTCDTRSQENRKDLSTPPSQASLPEGDVKIKQVISQSPLYNIVQHKDVTPSYTGFRPYNNESYNDLYSQTPCQINRLGYSMKQQFPYAGLSPFQQQIQQTPMVFTPLYLYNSQFIAQSPYKSPLMSPQQHLWMQQQQYEIEIQNEQMKQDQLSNNKLEFLAGQDLVSKWKHKRVMEKQNLQELNKITDQ